MGEKSYFESYNIVRFFLAILVVVTHCNQNLAQIGVLWYHDSPILLQGGAAVEFFFILSGFLLTYLYLQERSKYGQVNIYFFFVRRVLRIFPLYYLSVLIGYLLLGILYPMYYSKPYLAFSVSEGLSLHLCFLPNFVIAKWTENVGGLYSLWSIGVEEQFYITFPFIMFFVTQRKQPIQYLTIIFVLYVLFYIAVNEQIIFSMSAVVTRFVYTLKFHFMLIGAFFAFLFFDKKNTAARKCINNRVFQRIVYTLITYTLLCEQAFDRYNIAQGVIFGTFLWILAEQKAQLPNFTKTFQYGGKISFGIYIFHPYVSYLLRLGIEKFSFALSITTQYPILYYLSELSISIAVAHFSYRYYERYFLNLKSGY